MANTLLRATHCGGWHRHERMTVAMALAEATPHAAPRGPKTARAQEEVERETYNAPRHQNPPPPGTRPGLLSEREKEKRKEEEEVEKHMAVQSEVAEAMQRARLFLEHAGQEEKEEEEEEEEAAQGFLLSILVCLSRCSHPVLWTFFYAPLISGGLVRCHGVA